MEIDTGSPYNPIIQDKTKQKTPRFYAMDSLSNYGALPQTYEDPDHKDAWTGLLGDGDPIDVCDISSLPRPTGSVYRVKVLGALAMIDGGETDWKLLAVRTDDPLAAMVEDVEGAGVPDVVKKAMDDIRHWFRVYKVPEGKGENDFAFNGKWLDKGTAIKIIEVSESSQIIIIFCCALTLFEFRKFSLFLKIHSLVPLRFSNFDTLISLSGDARAMEKHC